MTYTTRTSCRVCGSASLESLFSLGNQYVSDFVPANRVRSGPQCPITLDLCRECTLVQARHTLPPDLLYRRHYWFHSGTTQTLRDALRDVVDAACRVGSLRPGDVVLDIGANDGTGLMGYPEGVVRVACEPAQNLHAECRQNCDVLVPDFWSASAYFNAITTHLLRDGYQPNACRKAKVVTACGMFYDLDDPNQFIADVARVLAPDGVFIAQLMCAKQMLERQDVGNLCHEHLEYYTLRSLHHLFRSHGLEIFDLEENAVNGGSYRLYVRHKGNVPGQSGEMQGRVTAASLAERWGEYPQTYTDWFARVSDNRDRCMEFLQHQRAEGKRIWILGASTKANVIAQFYGLTPDLIEAAAERSPEKVGLCMVGTGIPIRSEEDFRWASPDYAVVMPYGFATEIMEREKAWQAGGGRFVFVLPRFEVV